MRSFVMTLQAALDLHKSGQLDAAEDAYRGHLLVEPGSADALYLLGVLRQQRDDTAGAIELLRQAIAVHPDEAQFHLSLGGSQLRSGDMSGARASFERALTLDPNSVHTHTMLGHMSLQGGDAAAAEGWFRLGRRAADEDPLVLFGLGTVYLERNDAANAAKFLLRAAELRPDDAAVQTNLGRAFFEQGAFGLAEQAFDNALRLRPELGVAKLFLARSRLRQNKFDAARVLFSELVADNVQPLLANAALGDIARNQGRIVHALKHYRRALAMDPAHAGVALSCAWCMQQLGDPDAALRYLRDGLRRAPAAEELREPLAALLERMGRVDEAARVRERREASDDPARGAAPP